MQPNSSAISKCIGLTWDLLWVSWDPEARSQLRAFFTKEKELIGRSENDEFIRQKEERCYTVILRVLKELKSTATDYYWQEACKIIPITKINSCTDDFDFFKKTEDIHIFISQCFKEFKQCKDVLESGLKFRYHQKENGLTSPLLLATLLKIANFKAFTTMAISGTVDTENPKEILNLVATLPNVTNLTKLLNFNSDFSKIRDNLIPSNPFNEQNAGYFDLCQKKINTIFFDVFFRDGSNPFFKPELKSSINLIGLSASSDRYLFRRKLRPIACNFYKNYISDKVSKGKIPKTYKFSDKVFMETLEQNCIDQTRDVAEFIRRSFEEFRGYEREIMERVFSGNDATSQEFTSVIQKSLPKEASHLQTFFDPQPAASKTQPNMKGIDFNSGNSNFFCKFCEDQVDKIMKEVFPL